MMLVKNEAGRYLRRIIENTLMFASQIAVLDDHSTDNSIKICQEYAPRVVVKKARNTWFEGVGILRLELFNFALTLSPDWVITVDADTLYEETIRREVFKIMYQDKYQWAGFKVYHMWDSEEFYRNDAYSDCTVYHPRMFKVKGKYDYAWHMKKNHPQCVPLDMQRKPGYKAGTIIKHLGYMTSQDRQKKYERRLKEDPRFQYFPKEYYDSFYCGNPKVEKLVSRKPKKEVKEVQFNCPEFIKEFTAYVNNLGVENILEVGCLSGELADAVGADGIDVDPKREDVIKCDIRKFAVVETLDDIKAFPLTEYELVFSSGLIEHYPKDEAIDILRHKARVSKKYVLTYVPNTNCLAYKNNKAKTQQFWKDELDYTPESLAELHEAAGLKVIDKGTAGAEWAKRFGPEPSEPYLSFVLAEKKEKTKRSKKKTRIEPEIPFAEDLDS